MPDEKAAARRLEAVLKSLGERMQRAAGDLDYESYLHEKRTLERALAALKQRQAAEKMKPELFHSDFSDI